MADVKLMGADDAAWSAYANSNYIYYVQYVAVNSGRLKNISVNVSKSTNPVSGKFAVYSDTPGTPYSSPATLLTSIGDTNLLDGWNTISVPEIDIVSGTVYWLSFNTYHVDASAGIRRTTGSTYYYSKSTAYGGFEWSNPADYSGGTISSNRLVAIAGWGTEASAGCPRQAMHMRRLM